MQCNAFDARDSHDAHTLREHIIRTQRIHAKEKIWDSMLRVARGLHLPLKIFTQHTIRTNIFEETLIFDVAFAFSRARDIIFIIHEKNPQQFHNFDPTSFNYATAINYGISTNSFKLQIITPLTIMIEFNWIIWNSHENWMAIQHD